MNTLGGFVIIHKKILDWEWFRNTNTFVLFLYLILAANFEEARFEGRLIRRGQLATSLQTLADKTGLSVRQVRTALDHLITTGEVTNKTYNRYRVITVTNYDLYQDKRQAKRQADDKQMTSNRQADDKQMTSNRQQYNKNNKNNKKNNNPPPNGGEGVRAKRFTPPPREDVQAYCQENGIQIDVERFVDHYTSNGWMVGRNNPMKDWKAAVRNWARRDKQVPVREKRTETTTVQDYQQRDYSSEQDEAMERLLAWGRERE